MPASVNSSKIPARTYVKNYANYFLDWSNLNFTYEKEIRLLTKPFYINKISTIHEVLKIIRIGSF